MNNNINLKLMLKKAIENALKIVVAGLQSRTLILVLLSVFLVSMIFSTEITRKFPRDVAEILLVISIICLLLHRKCHKAYYPILFFTLSYPLAVGLSLLVTSYDEHVDTFRDYRKVLYFMLVPFMLWYSKFNVQDLGKLLTICVCIMIPLNVYFLYYLGLDRMGIDKIVQFVIIYDNSMYIMLAMALVYVFENHQRRKKTFDYTILLMLMLANALILFHGTRAIMVAMVATLIMITLMYSRKVQKFWLAYVMSSIVVMLLAVYTPLSLMYGRIKSLETMMELQAKNVPTSGGERLTMWRLALEDFVKNPWFGQGVEGIITTHCKAYFAKELQDCYLHAHSMLFHELSAHGVVGVIGLILFYGIPLYIFLKHYRSQHANSALAAKMGIVLVVTVVICGSLDLYLTVTQISLLFYTLMAVALMWWSQIINPPRHTYNQK